MAKLIASSNISTAWLLAMEHLKSVGGMESNLIVAVAPAQVESLAVRKLFDSFLSDHCSRRVRSIRTVADTIFPIDFYHPDMEGARNRLYSFQREAREIEARVIPRGTYFDRLIDWPGGQKTINQLEKKVVALSKGRAANRRNGSAYEMGVSVVQEVEGKDECTCGADLRIQDPARDNYIMGFPCLSHISLTLFKGRIDMTAVYRNQHFITKAYGNLVGLKDLQRFICRESGYSEGELVCVATHADGEFGANKIKVAEIDRLLTRCRAAVS